MTSGDPNRTRRKVRDDYDDPLTFPAAALMGEPPGSTREYDVHGVTVDPGDDLHLVAPVDGRIRLSRTNRGLLVDGRFNTVLEAECARCLRPVRVPLELEIDEEVLPSIDVHSGLPVEAEEGEDPEVVRLNDHHELELRPLVHEAISLAEPIAPLCEPDCPGLCSECGERLSPGHEHADVDIDPRLEALKGFVVDADHETG